MEAHREIWQNWAEILQRLRMDSLAASVLEAIGPFSLLGAQLVYLGQPMLNSLAPEGHLQALVDMLEDSQQTRAFVAFLREEKTP